MQNSGHSPTIGRALGTLARDFLRFAGPRLRPAAILVAHRDSTLAHCESVIMNQHSPSDATE